MSEAGAPASRSRRAYRVEGRVQGVGFRAFVVREARRLGLAGWVRNEPDGTVALEAEGEAAGLEALEALLGEGPPAARVTRLDSQRLAAGIQAQGFQIRF